MTDNRRNKKNKPKADKKYDGTGVDLSRPKRPDPSGGVGIPKKEQE